MSAHEARRSVPSQRSRIIARWSSMTIIAVAFLALAGSSVLATESPTLATDKADYQPGEVVHLSGSGYAAGDYAVPVKRPDGSIVLVDPVDHTATPGWGTTTVGEDGDLLIDYQLNGIAGG